MNRVASFGTAGAVSSSGFHLPSCNSKACPGCAGREPPARRERDEKQIAEDATVEAVCRYIETKWRAGREPLVVALRRGDWRKP